MTYPAINGLYQAMSNDMRNKLGTYTESLQSRYGDPRVYRAQQEQMRRDEAAVMHAKAKKTSALLEDAYKRQQERNRALHVDRLRSRVDQTSSSLPESQAPKGRRRKPEPPPAVA